MAIKQADELTSASRAEKLRASPRMFDSDLLDKLSRVHPSVPPILFVPTIAFLLVEGLARGVGWAAAAWVLGGYV
ncbi:MAG TPA: fatty acid hydroxylase, partial [Solirubrobacteraceae bacterium]